MRLNAYNGYILQLCLCIVNAQFILFLTKAKLECVHKLKRNTKRTIHGTNDARNERYTKRTNQLHERNANERKTKIERTIHENETNEKRKRYEIFVNLNDPGSVRRSQNYFCFKGLVYGV